MISHRRLQWGSAAVIANSLLVLSAFSSNVALATSCTGIELCRTVCPGTDDRAICQAAAPPGCTVKSTACFPAQCNGLPITLTCFFQ